MRSVYKYKIGYEVLGVGTVYMRDGYIKVRYSNRFTFNQTSSIIGRMRKSFPQALAAIGLVILGVIFLGVSLFIVTNVWDHYRRSPEAYCRTFDQEKKRLAGLEGAKYQSKLFDIVVDDSNELTRSYEALAGIAPKDILSYVENLRDEYREGRTDGFRFSDLIGSEVRIRDWNTKNCSL